MLAQILRTPSLGECSFFVREQDIQFRPSVGPDGRRFIHAVNLAAVKLSTANPSLTWEQLLQGMLPGGYLDIPNHIVNLAIEKARQRLMMVDGLITISEMLAHGVPMQRALGDTADIISRRYPGRIMINLHELDPIYCERLEEIARHRGPH